jgi:hypothetical protein
MGVNILILFKLDAFVLEQEEEVSQLIVLLDEQENMLNDEHPEDF